MTDAGVNTTVTTFERNGEQRVVVHAGGGVFAGGDARRRHLDVLADGTMKSLPATTAAPGGGGGGARRARPAAGAGRDRPVDVEHGRQLYAEACVACHGEGGDGGHGGGPTLVAGLPLETILAVSQGGPQHDAGLRPRVQRGRSQGRRELHRRRSREVTRRRPSAVAGTGATMLLAGRRRLDQL